MKECHPKIKLTFEEENDKKISLLDTSNRVQF